MLTFHCKKKPTPTQNKQLNVIDLSNSCELLKIPDKLRYIMEILSNVLLKCTNIYTRPPPPPPAHTHQYIIFRKTVSLHPRNTFSICYTGISLAI